MPATLAHARQWAADLGPAHPLFEIVRGCVTILRYACHMRLFTMQGWALPVGVSRDSGASEDPVMHRDSARRTLGNRSPRREEELPHPSQHLERREEARRTQFEEPETSAAGEVLETSGGERVGETKSETVSTGLGISQEEILRAQTAFIHLDSSRLPLVSGFHSSKLLAKSLSECVELILKRGQNVLMSLQSPVWVDGWLRPFKEVVLDSLPAKSTPAILPEVIRHALETFQRSLSDGMAGPAAFKQFLTNIANDLQASDLPAKLSKELRTFAVPAGTSFSAYAPQLLKLLGSVENASGTIHSVNVATVMDFVRKSIFAQFPPKIEELFPGDR